MRKEALSGYNVKLYTKQKVSVGTNFYLKLSYSGQSSEICRISFNIEERDIMYHLDFRVKYGRSYKKLIQTKQKNGAWQGHSKSCETMNLVEGDNDVSVKVGPEYFKVWLNGVKYKENILIDPTRLSRYSSILIEQTGTCVSFGMEQSYTYTIGKCRNIEYCVYYLSEQIVLILYFYFIVAEASHFGGFVSS